MNREKWFAENQWYLDAMRKGEMVEFSNYKDFGDSCNEIASGVDLDLVHLYKSKKAAYIYARPIPKKKMRPMTREEILLFCLNNPKILIKQNSGCRWDGVWFWAFDSAVTSYEYIEIPEGYKGDFSDLEVKKFEVPE